MSFQNREVYTYNYIQERKRDGRNVQIDMYAAAITEKLKGGSESFGQVEEMFEELHDKRDSIREGTNYYSRDVAAYQKTITNMIRFAPTPAQARKYATLLFRDVSRPLRTPRLEVNALANLIYVYGTEGSSESMREALDIIELAIEIGIFEIGPEHYRDNTGRITNLRNPIEMFESISQRVLRYHNLVFSNDRTRLIPKYT